MQQQPASGGMQQQQSSGMSLGMSGSQLQSGSRLHGQVSHSPMAFKSNLPQRVRCVAFAQSEAGADAAAQYTLITRFELTGSACCSALLLFVCALLSLCSLLTCLVACHRAAALALARILCACSTTIWLTSRRPTRLPSAWASRSCSRSRSMADADGRRSRSMADAKAE